MTAATAPSKTVITDAVNLNTDEELGSLDDAVNVGGNNFEGAGTMAEDMQNTAKDLKDGNILVGRFAEINRAFLIKSQHCVIAKDDSGPSVCLDPHRVAETQVASIIRNCQSDCPSCCNLSNALNGNKLTDRLRQSFAALPKRRKQLQNDNNNNPVTKEEHYVRIHGFLQKGVD